MNYKPLPPDAQFDAFWKAYPRKMNKGDARKAWEQTKAVRPLTVDIIKAVTIQKFSPQWTRDDGQFIPYPASWLRGERWEDSSEIELAEVVNGKMWWESTVGIDAKAAELGLEWDNATETYQQFTARVRRVAEGKHSSGLRAVA